MERSLSSIPGDDLIRGDAVKTLISDSDLFYASNVKKFIGLMTLKVREVKGENKPPGPPSDREIREGGGGADYTRDGCERGAFDDEMKVPFNLLEKDLCKNLNLLSINEQRKAAANQIARDGWTAFFDLCELLTRGLHEITFRIHQEDVTCFLHGPWAGIPAAGRGKDMTVAFQRAAQVARKCLDYMDREKDNLNEEERHG